jgi:hypothetical protein
MRGRNEDATHGRAVAGVRIGFSTRSVTPGAPREFSACSRHFASKPWRIASVPITVIGLPRESRAGRKPVASPVMLIAFGSVRCSCILDVEICD